MALSDAYDEEQVAEGDVRTVLHFHPTIAPVTVAVLPLVKKDGLAEYASKLEHELREDFATFYDQSGAIGRRYRRMDEEESVREIAFIREQLPQDLKTAFSDDDLYYFLDAIVDYYYDSGILESTAEEVDIDLQAVANAICEQALRDKQGRFNPEEVVYVVEADMDFQEQSL